MPNILKAIYDEVVKHRSALEKASNNNNTKATKQHLRPCVLCRAFCSEVDAYSKTDVDDGDESATKPLAAAPLTPFLYKEVEPIPANKRAFCLNVRHSKNVNDEEEEDNDAARGEDGIGLLRPIFGAKNRKNAGRQYDDDNISDDDIGDNKDDGDDNDDVDRENDPCHEDLLRPISPSLKMWTRNGCKGDLHLRLLGKAIFLDESYATSSKLSKKVRKCLWGYAYVRLCACVCMCVGVCA